MSQETTDNRIKVTMKELENAIRNAGEPITAKELSKKFPITNTQVNRKLDDLVEDGKIESKEAGSAAVVYWDPNCFPES